MGALQGEPETFTRDLEGYYRKDLERGIFLHRGLIEGHGGDAHLLGL